MEFLHSEKGVIDTYNEKAAIIWAILGLSTLIPMLVSLLAVANGIQIKPQIFAIIQKQATIQTYMIVSCFALFIYLHDCELLAFVFLMSKTLGKIPPDTEYFN